MSVDLRAARPEDAEAILAIWAPIIRDTTITFTHDIPSRSDVEAAITAANAAQDPYIVAVSEAVVCGFARLTTFRSGSGYAKTKELTIHLHPTARGQGLGRRLLDALEEHARATNVATLVAGISATNSTALNFHTKLGYVECGRIARAGFKFDHHIDLVLMQKIL